MDNASHTARMVETFFHFAGYYAMYVKLAKLPKTN